jgi:hypothetical protein
MQDEPVEATWWSGPRQPTLLDTEWIGVPARELVLVGDGSGPVCGTHVRVVVDEHALWLHYTCSATVIRAEMRHYKDKVWQEDAVEVYLRPPDDSYLYEFQLNAIGTLRDLRVLDAGEADQVFDDSWSCLHIVTEAAISTDGAGQPIGWRAMFGLPWRSFERSRPTQGSPRWQLGAFRIQREPEEFSALGHVRQDEMELHVRGFLRSLSVPPAP